MTPAPFIICRALDETYLPLIDNGDVSLNMSALKCNYVYSKPTGYTNSAISTAFLQRGAPKASLSMINTSQSAGSASNSASQNKSAAAMLREH